MNTVSDILEYLCEIAPLNIAEEWDNVGLLCGDSQSQVKKALISLDITSRVVDEAQQKGAQLIISHHPVIFHPLKAVNADSVVWKLANNSISAICMHTNLDICNGGVNDELAVAFELDDIIILEVMGFGENYGLGRVGNLKNKLSLIDFADFVKQKLNITNLKICEASKEALRVAICGGADDGNMISASVKAGADTLVIGEMKHSSKIEALEKGLNIIEAGHFATENIIFPRLLKLLSEKFNQIIFEIAENNTDPCYIL